METPMSSIVQTGDLGGQKVAMRIDENALAHIMAVLTDLYSDPQMAVIREYSTNARDSHIEAGNPAPIEVTTPSALSPYFIVRDYGVGLSVDDIVNMYSKYGASTKRGTNDQVGMLGLGAKSALTLVPQFNITSVKNGVKILVSVSRAADGSGQMEIIDTKSTTDRNGVEVKIPVPRDRAFADKCKQFFRFWEKGTVLVDGKEPEHVDGRWVGDKMVIDKTLSQDHIVMGNVAYPVKDGLYSGHYYSHLGIVAFVEIGAVNFTPSREQLHYTPQTRATIARIKQEFTEKLVESAQKEIDQAKSFPEAWRLASEWRQTFRSIFNTALLTYRDVKVPSQLPLDGKWRVVELTAVRASKYWSYANAVSSTSKDDLLFITGFNESLKMSPAQRERTKKYIEQAGLKFTRAAVSNQQSFPVNDWTKDIHVVDWSVISQIKIDRAKAAPGVKRSEPYEVYVGSYGYKSISDFDTSKPIIYISPAEHKQPGFLRTMFPDAQIVMLGQNRWEKFKRDWPTAMHWERAARKERDKLAAKITEDDKILWHYRSSFRYMLSGIDHTKIEDPELSRFVRVISDQHLDFSPAAQAARVLPHEIGTVQVDCPANPLRKYPLVDNLRRADQEHVLWYLNTYYTTTLKKKEN